MGHCPIAPGTAGSLLALIIYVLMLASRPVLFTCATAFLFFIGVWAATETEKTHGHDASVIVVDEMVGMWIAVAFPASGPAWIWPAASFLLFRLFDIVKPFPANVSQKLPKGWGVMVDDVVAGVYSNLALRAVIWIAAKGF
jgi:phosphatidylglycerophosphatase A